MSITSKQIPILLEIEKLEEELGPIIAPLLFATDTSKEDPTGWCKYLVDWPEHIARAYMRYNNLYLDSLPRKKILDIAILKLR